MSSAPVSPPPPAHLEPPFKGLIVTTEDALLVFEAARRGMIPRVTRRLIDRERPMVQSGAVFIFDESESGIKRWTDGLVWSPSRILGNFLVYRETEKKNGPGLRPATQGSSSSPSQTSPSVGQHVFDAAASTTPPSPLTTLPSEMPPFGGGELRPRSSSDSMVIDKQLERQLVGSLTNSYKFKEGGLVKKTMSLTVNGYAQHLISYYSMEDAVSGKLRCPTTIPELAALEISSSYLQNQNFRFPPETEVGPDGIRRFKAEGTMPLSPVSGSSAALYPANGGSDPHDIYSQIPQPMRLDQMPVGRPQRSAPIPMTIPISPAASASSYAAPGSASSTGYFGEMSPVGTSHVRPGGAGPARPGSSRSSRYDPYMTSPRPGSASIPPQSRRMSGGQPDPSSYYQTYDVKPVAGPNGQMYYPDYNYYGSAPPPAPHPPPSTSSSMQPPASYPVSQYAGWQVQSTSLGRSSAHTPRQVSTASSSAGPIHQAPGLTTPYQPPTQASQISPTSPTLHTPSAAAAPSHEWTPAPAGWDPQAHAHLQGPGQYQPPPPATHSQYEASAPPWRDGSFPT